MKTVYIQNNPEDPGMTDVLIEEIMGELLTEDGYLTGIVLNSSGTEEVIFFYNLETGKGEFVLGETGDGNLISVESGEQEIIHVWLNTPDQKTKTNKKTRSHFCNENNFFFLRLLL